MTFIVIEGDNGTGKDTIASKLAEYGYSIITYLPEVKKEEHVARTSVDKTNAFLVYNDFCGNSATNSDKSSIIIRYWISTIAAAYADGIYDYDKVMSLTDRLKKTMPRPTFIVRLWVGNTTRLNRILLRNKNNPDLSDDVTITRAQRYEWISKEILNRSGYRWKEFDNTSVDVEKLTKHILACIKENA